MLPTTCAASGRLTICACTGLLLRAVCCCCCCQACLALDKRVLLEGLGGSPQEVMLDHRANHPAFNITR